MYQAAAEAEGKCFGEEDEAGGQPGSPGPAEDGQAERDAERPQPPPSRGERSEATARIESVPRARALRRQIGAIGQLEDLQQINEAVAQAEFNRNLINSFDEINLNDPFPEIAAAQPASVCASVPPSSSSRRKQKKQEPQCSLDALLNGD